MFFYEDLVKNVEKKEVNLDKEKYKFSLNFRTKIIKIGTGLPLILIGLYYMADIVNKKLSISAILGALIFYTGILIVQEVFTFRLIIDKKNDEIITKTFRFNISSIDSIELKKMVIPRTKKIEACLDIITVEKKQYIIPLVMNKKIEFCAILRELKREKFKIIKDDI
ncbi:hypothetical protein EV215_1472 [Hypnocyclicus thermotrophus]|uniref:Uncharacterized protein n=1 Tax=Hypnocyclicus thermotrophus TaxID=1627895 RepID=A0AA46DY95_9FUSO|nr:hypothetical protein [Hypnocyclicus thermotrophus]TDT69130.1 hypothetical protein EV215_1472 [Hypnocyclicus thermotrophus]